MSLKAKFSNDFRPKIRDRGHAYFRSKAVEILEHSESHVEARVKGSVNYYLVRLLLGRVSLDVACTCPYFEKGEECKHVWATMLAADSNQYLTRVDLMPKLQIRYDEDAVKELRESSKNEQPAVKNKAEEQPVWQRQLSLITSNAKANLVSVSNKWSSRREIFYIIDVGSSRINNRLSFEIKYRERRMNGDWSKLRSERIPKSAIASLKEPADREILAILSGATGGYFAPFDQNYNSVATYFSISNALQPVLFPLMCSTGRCVLNSKEQDPVLQPIDWDNGAPWQFWLDVQRDDSTNEYLIRPLLRRDEEQIDIGSAVLLIEDLLITPDRHASTFDSRSACAWTGLLRDREELRVPAEHSHLLIGQLLELPGDFNLELPKDLQFERIRGTPSPHLIVRKPKYAYSTNPQLEAQVFFDYHGIKIDSFDPRHGVYEANERRFLVRDREQEERARSLLSSLGFKTIGDYDNKQTLQLSPKKLPQAVRALIEEGWKVEAEGKLYRNARASSLSVSSGIDWFELHGSLSFGDGLEVKLPEIGRAHV